MAEEEKKKKAVGRPKKTPRSEEEAYNEEDVERLDMSNRKDDTKTNTKDEYLTVDGLVNRWTNLFSAIAAKEDQGYNAKKKNFSLAKSMTRWNDLNPFLQNERLKQLNSTPSQYSKDELHKYISNPGSFQQELRSAAWSSSTNQQIYYNILRRACDIPIYNYYIVPDLLDGNNSYKDVKFIAEDRLIHEWFENLNVPSTFKTVALQVKREGKQSYILRNKITGKGKEKKVQFVALEKLPSDWIKITGIGQLGYTISFNFLYFMNEANNPAYFGEFVQEVWDKMISDGIITKDENNIKGFNIDKARNFTIDYQGSKLTSTIETIHRKMKGMTDAESYMFWVKMPFDLCYTFCSDCSHSWATPDTIATLEKLQELTDYGKLAGLIASTPLTAILTGEAEYIDGARAGKTETKISPEVLKGLQDTFNAVTSTNVEAFFYPLKNIKLQQLATDVNSSEIISAATENFVEVSGESGLTITTDKPNISQIKTAQLLAASQQRYVTLQFENVLNYIIQHKIGMEYKWTVKIWGDIFSQEADKKYLKEIVANGNIALLPKLMSAEGLSMRNTKALVEYIKSLDFYKDFQTYTMEKAQKMKIQEQNSQDKVEGQSGVGRPALDDDEVENDATGSSKEAGTNTVDNRDHL